MARTVRITFDPVGRRGDFPLGTDVLDAARLLGVGLSSVCGGAGTCGHCRVRVDGAASPISEEEGAVLSPEEIAEGCRLGCQLRAEGDLLVLVPLESLTTTQRIHLEGSDPRRIHLDPAVRVRDVVLVPPSLGDLRSDWTRLRDALGSPSLSLDAAALAALPLAARENGWTFRALLRGGEVVGFLPAGSEVLGVAVDLGTTTLAAYLLSLESGRVLARRGVMNPQIAHGEDLVSRMGYGLRGADEASTLRREVVSAVAGLVGDMLREAGATAEQVAEYVVVGNTAMHHLFLGLPVGQLAYAPYVAAVNDAVEVKAREVGLPAAAGAYVHLLPNVAGFVGADHVAMLLGTDLPEARGTAVALDIGTNTEISLIHDGRIYCCSCASGPAFEGAHLRDGMRAGPGAIERVQISEGKLSVQTIEDVPAVGICGSGVLDAVAQLRQAGILDARGRFVRGEPPGAARRGELYILVPACRSGTGRDVGITRGDIGEIQLAKAAIRAGIERLALEAGTTTDRLDEMIVAGAFGAYLSVASAVAIGMFPPLPLSRIRQVGNAAGTGARHSLLSLARRQAAHKVAEDVTYVELSGDRQFSTLFARHLRLGHPSIPGHPAP